MQQVWHDNATSVARQCNKCGTTMQQVWGDNATGAG
jgi:hypothetical protein